MRRRRQAYASVWHDKREKNELWFRQEVDKIKNSFHKDMKQRVIEAADNFGKPMKVRN